MEEREEGELTEREEGELTDDSEEVSDCSMSPGSRLNCGKSVTAELLRDVSLSSVGSAKEFNNARMTYERNTRRYYQRNQRLLSPRGFRRKRKMTTLSPNKTNHLKRRRRSLLHHSDSDDDSLDPKYVKKLREALHHETPCTLLHSSLKTRLKGFIKPGSQSDDDDESELRDIALSTCAVGENDKDAQICNVKSNEVEEKKTEDFELQQLRIAALRSFVMENHKKRKNKAAVTESKEGAKVENVNDDVNKENDQGVINNEEKKEPEKDEMSNGSCEVDLIEEDVDILRTMLLASMSTKLIEKTKVEDTKATDNLLNPIIKVDNKVQPNDKKINNFLPNKVVVKPLIINVGDSDSDSDTDVVTKDEQTTESVVAEFLKRQRAKVEAKEHEVKLKNEISTLKVNHVVPSSTSSVVKTPNNTTKKPYDDFLLDKSEVKLLPRSKQLEYRKLKMQLINATRKKLPLKVSSFTKRENNSLLVNLNAKKVPKFIKNDATNLDNKSGVVNGNIDLKFIPQDRKSVNSTQDLQRTLDGLQIRRNGRLQIKGKYLSLQPLLNKINRASHERMLNEKEIKVLLQKLQQARSRFTQMDQHFSNLVQQLVNGKNVIDQRILKVRAFNDSTTKKVNVVPLVKISEEIVEKVAEDEKNLVESKNVDSIAVDANLISGKNLCDANDIVQDVPQTSVGVSSFTNTSPLDNRKGRDTTLKEVDSDVESYEPRKFNKFRKFKQRKRPNPLAKSETQGDGDASENTKPPRIRRRQRFFRRRRLPRSEERDSGTDKENIVNGGEGEQPVSQSDSRKNRRPRRPFPRNKPQIDFSLIVSNIEKTVRIRELKNALIENGIKPSDITWRGYRGFCYLHYAKPKSKAAIPEEPRQVDSVIEILQNMKISPHLETNLSVQVMDPISRIETTDITAV